MRVVQLSQGPPSYGSGAFRALLVRCLSTSERGSGIPGPRKPKSSTMKTTSGHCSRNMQNEVGTKKSFFELRIFIQKVPLFFSNSFGLDFVGPKNPAKSPPNLPQDFPATQAKKNSPTSFCRCAGIRKRMIGGQGEKRGGCSHQVWGGGRGLGSADLGQVMCVWVALSELT